MKITHILTAAAVLVGAGVVSAAPAEAHVVTCRLSANMPVYAGAHRVHGTALTVCSPDVFADGHLSRVDLYSEVQIRTQVIRFGPDIWHTVGKRTTSRIYRTSGKTQTVAMAVGYCPDGSRSPHLYRTLSGQRMFGTDGTRLNNKTSHPRYLACNA